MGGVRARDVMADNQDSSKFDDLDDLYGQRTLIKKKAVKEQTENERLTEEIARRKIQIKNATKNLMKVDEFLVSIQTAQKGAQIDPNKLNYALTDLRDAINMLN